VPRLGARTCALARAVDQVSVTREENDPSHGQLALVSGLSRRN
jgi:hypothetical protein